MPTLPLPSECLVGQSYGGKALPTARDYPRHPTFGLTVVIHYWMWAVIWTWMVIGAASVVYGVEKVLFLNGMIAGRAAFNPALFSAHFFGMAHYTVAIYLLFTSKNIRSLRGMSMLLLYSSFALLPVEPCRRTDEHAGDHRRLHILSGARITRRNIFLSPASG